MLQIPELSDADVVFSASPPLPAWNDIPEDFRENWSNQDHPWCRIPSKWFFAGGSLQDFGLTPKEGLDQKAAMRAIKACLGSFQPSHEHKIAGVAFMLSEWFDQPDAE